MKPSDYFYVIGGILVGALITTLAAEWTADNQNFVYILGVIINGLILIIIATILNKSQNNSRALKEYFINQLTLIEKDYSSFHDSLLEEKLTKDQITRTYKVSTMKIDQFNHFLHKNYSIKCEVQKLNRECHFISSDSLKFDMLKPHDFVSLTNKQKFELEAKIKSINYLFINTCIEINKS